MNGKITPNPLVLWIIHFAFMAAVPMYALVYTFILLPPELARGIKPQPLFLAVLGGIALVAIIMGLGIKIWFKPKLGQSQSPEGSAGAYLAKTQNTIIVSDAMFESVAVYGLIGIFMGFQPWQSYMFMVVSMACLAFQITRIRSWLGEYALLKDNEMQ